MVTIKEIAERVGVSPSEVSRVLRGRERQSRSVSPATRRKILDVARELNYQPNMIARALVTRRTNIIGAALYNITNPFFARISTELESELRAHRLQMLLSTGERADVPPPPGEGAEEEADPGHLKYLEPFFVYNVAGILFWNWERFSLEDQQAWEQAGNRAPLVLMGRVDADVAIDRVMIDQSAGGRLVTEHLLAQGYRRIAFAGIDATWNDPYSKYLGYAEAMRGAGRQPEVLADNVHSLEEGYRLGRRLLEAADRPDAVVAGIDFAAMGLMRAVCEAGLSVPGDLAVTGFDDNPVGAYSTVTLTTLRQPYVEAAKAAVGLLLDRLNERADADVTDGQKGDKAKEAEGKAAGVKAIPPAGSASEPTHRVIRLEPTLVVRESTVGVRR